MEKLLTATMIFLIVLVIFSIFYTDKRISKCNALGGVYINAQCYKAELINLDNK